MKSAFSRHTSTNRRGRPAGFLGRSDRYPTRMADFSVPSRQHPAIARRVVPIGCRRRRPLASTSDHNDGRAHSSDRPRCSRRPSRRRSRWSISSPPTIGERRPPRPMRASPPVPKASTSRRCRRPRVGTRSQRMGMTAPRRVFHQQHQTHRLGAREQLPRAQLRLGGAMNSSTRIPTHSARLR